MWYSVALFVHVIGAAALFAALGLEWMALWQLRRATSAEQARERAAAFAVLPRLYGPAMAAILVAGLYMTATVWGWSVGWTAVALAAMVLLAAVGAVLSGPRMAPLGRALAAESGPLSPALREQLRNPLLWTSMQVRLGIAVGIVYLMTVKPGPGGALLAIVVAALLGLAVAVPAWNRRRALDMAA